jgi:hypothetical protein
MIVNDGERWAMQHAQEHWEKFLNVWLHMLKDVDCLGD